MRLAPGAACDILIARAEQGTTFQFVSFVIVGGIFNVKSENIRFASFGKCGLGYRQELNALIYRLDDGQAAIFMPTDLEGQFPGLRPPKPFEPFPFFHMKEFRQLLPAPIEKYANLDGDFVGLHLKAIDHYILQYANFRHGKFYHSADFDSAVQKLFEEREKDAPFLGVTATSSLVIRLGPLLLFFLSFELWRRVRRLPAGKLDSGQYWFGFESRDLIGRSYAYFCTITPLLIGIISYALFVVSQGLSLIVFDRVVTLEGLLTLDFPAAPPPGWQSKDRLAIIFGLLFPLQFLILILIARKLMSVVRANLRRQ